MSLTRTYNCAYNYSVFEWDLVKAKHNHEKHGIAFADTFGVFEDPRSLTIERRVRGELRYVTIGLDAFERLLVVVYTRRGKRIRIISARKACRDEVNQYEGEI